MKHTKYRKLLLSLFFILIIALIILIRRNISYFISIPEEVASFWLQFAEVVGLGITILFTIQQLYESKEIARATFIMELNQNFVGNSDYMRTYNILQSIYDNRNNTDNQNEPPVIEKGSISNYLTFFETIYILKNRGVLTFAVIDDLFAYRFFMAVHSELFQNSKLGPQPENFINIFKLEKEWLEYRVHIHKTTDEELDAAYRKFVDANNDGKTIIWDNVYEARQLRGLVDPERYDRIIKGKSAKKAKKH